jgi:hypothetical protein
MNKERLCMIVQIVYHLLFLGGASFYVTEFQKTRDMVIQQIDRVENMSKDLKQTSDNASSAISSLNEELRNTQNACRRLLR